MKKEETIVNERVSKEMKKNSTELYNNFKKFFKKLKENADKLSLEEFAWCLYNQGHLDNTSVGVDITEDEWETECFLNFVKDCIVNPQNEVAENTSTDYVRISYPCSGHLDCHNWPDRCEDVGGDGYTCSRLLNINKLCGIEAKKVTKDIIYPFKEYEFRGTKFYSFNNIEEFCRIRFGQKSLKVEKDGVMVDLLPQRHRKPLHILSYGRPDGRRRSRRPRAGRSGRSRSWERRPG